MKTRLALAGILLGAAGVVAAVFILGDRVENPPQPEPAHVPRLRARPRPLPMPPDGRRLIDGFSKEARKHAFAGEYAQALGPAESALKFMFDWGLEQEAAEFRIEIARWYFEAGQLDRGASYLVASYVDAIGREGADWTRIADKAQNEHAELAFDVSDLGRHDDALRLLETILREFRKRGNRFQEAQALHNQAWVISDSGAHEKALGVYEKALFIRREIRDEENAGWTLNNMGYTLIRAGRHEEAATRLDEALSVASAGWRHLWRKAVDNDVINSSSAAAAGKTAFAVKRLTRLAEMVGNAGMLFLSERVLFEKARIAREAGMFAEAEEALATLVELEESSGYEYGKAAFLLETGKTLAIKGEIEAAISKFEEASAVFGGIGAAVEASWTHDAAARALSRAGRKEEAVRRFETAVSGFKSAGPFNPGLAESFEGAASDLQALGRAAEAAQARESALKARETGPAQDLERVIQLVECERRGPILAKMDPSDPMFTVRRVEDGWIFHDRPVDREIFVPFGWPGRHVTFQGTDFRVEGGMLSHAGFQVYLPVGSAAQVTIGGDFSRVR